jgi:S-adenosylmethionine/arginine decarboxylase-like enzyme
MDLKHFGHVENANSILAQGLFHQHLLVKAFVKNPPREVEPFEKWLANLVQTINMKIVAGPVAKYVNAVGNSGITGFCLIETSHIVCHCWDEPDPAMLQFDVYSCSCFDPQVVIDSLKQFGLVSYESMMIHRNTDMKIIERKTADCD